MEASTNMSVGGGRDEENSDERRTDSVTRSDSEAVAQLSGTSANFEEVLPEAPPSLTPPSECTCTLLACGYHSSTLRGQRLVLQTPQGSLPVSVAPTEQTSIRPDHTSLCPRRVQNVLLWRDRLVSTDPELLHEPSPSVLSSETTPPSTGQVRRRNGPGTTSTPEHATSRRVQHTASDPQYCSCDQHTHERQQRILRSLIETPGGEMPSDTANVAAAALRRGVLLYRDVLFVLRWVSYNTSEPQRIIFFFSLIWTHLQAGFEALIRDFKSKSRQGLESQPTEMTDPRTVTCSGCLIYLPRFALGCGHLLCELCKYNLKKCPQCKVEITNNIYLYL